MQGQDHRQRWAVQNQHTKHTTNPPHTMPKRQSSKVLCSKKNKNNNKVNSNKINHINKNNNSSNKNNKNSSSISSTPIDQRMWR